MPTVTLYAIQLLNALPPMIAAGQSVIELVKHGNEALAAMQAQHRDPTPAEWDALNAKIASLRSELHDKPMKAAPKK